MLEVSHLTKKYGKVLANEDLNFMLPEGTITVMLGPNGAGKSTAIKSIIGFLKYHGQITVEGVDNKSVPAKKTDRICAGNACTLSQSDCYGAFGFYSKGI